MSRISDSAIRAGFLCTLLVGFLAVVPAASASVTAGLNHGVVPITLAELFPGAEFDPDIPTQVEVTGVEPGQRPLRPEEVLTFYQALVDASPRARLLEYGRSHEGRPMVLLAISDEATISDLEGFKEQHA